MPASRFTLFCSLSFCFAVASSAGGDEIDFNRDVRPILSDKCFQCHGPDGNTRKADLRLDTKDGLFGVRDGVPVVPSEGHDGLLLERVLSIDADVRMPPDDSGKRLNDHERGILERWIEEGATWSGHWAFQPARKPVVPNGEVAIDHFVRARLQASGLSRNPIVDPATLIRRLTLDLTGLPPTRDEVRDFVGDTKDGAYERLVDRLLKSSRYGEHMAWSWLDAARYADSDGYESDPLRNMWPWRDWVVAAFNENMPYDRFIIEQLAGDMLSDSTMRTKLATGFNRNHRLNNEGGILPEEWLVEYVCDRAETTATVFMGLTWGCARCHDHKFDPITQRDYYRLFAFFNRMDEKGSASGSRNAVPMMQVASLENLEEFEATEKQFAPLERRQSERLKQKDVAVRFAAWTESLSDKDRKTLPKALAANPVSSWDKKLKERAKLHYVRKIDEQGATIEKLLAPIRKRRDELARTGSLVMIMTDTQKPRDSFVLHRGQYDQPTDRIDAGTPDWLPAMDDKLSRNRLGLAHWLVSSDHPLTARVAVNRIWDHFFDTGLVKTQEDFGRQGESPSHPELLDWLAVTFRESGWDVKQLIRSIITSNTYRQSSSFANTKAMASDPGNRLFWRASRDRMSAAMIRDQALFVSGLMTHRMGGAPVKPYQPDGLWREIVKGGPTYKPDKGEKLYRRSLYTLWRRAVKPPLMMLLDSNPRDTCRVSQRRTNTPLQALLLLNDVTFVEASRGLATRIVLEGGDTVRSRVEFAMELVAARKPTDTEFDVFAKAVASFESEFANDEIAAASLLKIGESRLEHELPTVELATWTAFARLLLNLDEVMTRE